MKAGLLPRATVPLFAAECTTWPPHFEFSFFFGIFYFLEFRSEKWRGGRDSIRTNFKYLYFLNYLVNSNT